MMRASLLPLLLVLLLALALVGGVSVLPATTRDASSGIGSPYRESYRATLLARAAAAAVDATSATTAAVGSMSDAAESRNARPPYRSTIEHMSNIYANSENAALANLVRNALHPLRNEEGDAADRAYSDRLNSSLYRRLEGFFQPSAFKNVFPSEFNPQKGLQSGDGWAVLRSGGGSRAMIASVVWDHIMGTDKLPSYGLSGGSWSLGAMGHEGGHGTAADIIQQWRNYTLQSPKKSGNDKLDKIKEWFVAKTKIGMSIFSNNNPNRNTVTASRNFLGSGEFSRVDGLMFDNYQGYRDAWTDYVDAAVDRPFQDGKETRIPLTGRVLIGAKFPGRPYFSYIVVTADNKWKVHHSNGHTDTIRSMIWKNVGVTPTIKKWIKRHLLRTSKDGSNVPLTIKNALVLSSAAFTGASEKINSEYTYGIRMKVKMGNNNKVTDDVQLFDIGVRCNIPFPVYRTDLDDVDFLSYDSSDSKTLYQSVDQCIPEWKKWGWTAMKLKEYKGFKNKFVDPHASVPRLSTSGISILRMQRRDGKAVHIVNLPIAKLSQTMYVWTPTLNMKYIHTMVSDNNQKKSVIGKHLYGALYPQQFGFFEINVVVKSVQDYFWQLIKVNAMPSTTIDKAPVARRIPNNIPTIVDPDDPNRSLYF